MTTFEKQRQAIKLSIIDARRELQKARIAKIDEAEKAEWVSDCEARIEGLTAATETISQMEALSGIIAKMQVTK